MKAKNRKKSKKKPPKNRPNNKVVSSSNLLSDKYGARDTLNFHYVALFSSKRLSRTLERTHILHDCTRSQAYIRLMVNAWNVTVPYQTARSLVVERISFMRAVGAIFQKKSETKITKGHCAIFMYYQPKKIGNKNAERPLCSLNLISLWGMCSRKRQSLFNFQFCLPLLSSADPRLGRLGLKIVCLKQNRRRVARPDLCRAWCRRGGFVSFFLFVCRLFFMWNAHCQAKTVPAFARCDLTHTQTHATPRGRTRRFGRKHKQ